MCKKRREPKPPKLRRPALTDLDAWMAQIGDVLDQAPAAPRKRDQKGKPRDV